MLCESFSKSKIKPTTSRDFIKNVVETLSPHGMLKLAFAVVDGKKASGGIFLLFNGTVYFWSGAALNEFNKFAPNNLLQWHIIRWASRNNYRMYDMAGKGIERIDRFKESFGPQVAAYSYLWKANGVLAKTSRELYKTFMNIRRRKGRSS